MRRALVSWFCWSILFAALPYLAIMLFVAPVFPTGASTLERATGSGQFLLTSIALLGGALKELTSEGIPKDSMALHLLPFPVVYACAQAVGYGAIAIKVKDGIQDVDLGYVVGVSIWSTVFSVILALSVVIVSVTTRSTSRE